MKRGAEVVTPRSQGGNINQTFFAGEHRGDPAWAVGRERGPAETIAGRIPHGRGAGSTTAEAYGRNTFADLRNY